MTDTTPSDPLAKVRNLDGTVDWLAVGEAEQARRCNRATGDMIGVLDWLHANGGTYNVAQAAHRFAGHLAEHVRHYPAPKIALAPALARARSCSRTARPRERRSSASSSTSGADPCGSDSDLPAEPPLRLAPPARAVLTFWALSAAERGADVEAVVS